MDFKIIKGSTTSILFTHENKENDEMLHKIFFKKYEIKKSIGKTSDIDIYEGINLQDKNEIIIKVEPRDSSELYLELESYNLYLFKDLGIPKIITLGKTKNSIILIEEKLGPSLYNLFLQNKRKFSLNEICCIGIQCIERLKGIHSHNYIHRNIKPENFLVGLDNPHVIYLQNFYLCEKYKSSSTNKHAKLSFSKKMVGTERYGSVNALRGLRQSRRDDLESLGYMLIYFFLGKLPWQGIKAESEKEKYQKLLEAKKKFNIDNYKDAIPEEFRTIFKMIKNLKFDEQPKYSLYIKLLQNIREKNHCFDENNFFLVKKGLKLKKNNIKTKKEDIRERPLQKIKTSEKTESPEINQLMNDDFELGGKYIEESDENDLYNINSLFNKDPRNIFFNKKLNNKEEINNDDNDINESRSSNSSINTRVYKMNEPLKNVLKNFIKDDKDIDDINELENKGSIKSNTKNSQDNNNIENIIKEENSDEEKDNKEIYKKEDKEAEKEKIDNKMELNNDQKDNNKEVIVISDHFLKSTDASNSSNVKDSKEKENNAQPLIIMANKKNNEIKNEDNLNKNKALEIKKKENKFGQIMGPEANMVKVNNKSSKAKKDKNKECIIF